MELYVVGKAISEDGKQWAFCGVFDTKAQAEACCKDWRYWVGPVPLNFATPEEDVNWPGSYFPKAEVSTVGN